MSHGVGRLIFVSAFVSCLTASAFAQGGNATISGTVFDPNKAVLPGVTVTVTNDATGIARDTVTGAEGEFVVPTLPPGTYTIRAELSGFQSQTRSGVALLIGQEVEVDLTLGVAGVAETVTVSAEAPLIDTTASRIGANVTAREIDTLPSQGRNHLSLMQLVPGLVPDLTPGEFEGGNFNVAGRTTASNVWNVDGAANQDTDGGATGPQARITLDSMAEFQVLTHQYTAEYGGSSGVIVNAVTKSGTNAFTGRGFYYLEDDKLRAIDPFLKEEGVTENPESGRDTFGFNIGGPIVRNRAFFFFNAERNLIENAVVHQFPTEAAPIATDYADASIIKAMSTFARVDYNLTENNNLSFRWQREVAPAVGEDFECCQTLENRQIELDSNDRLINVQHTAIIGNAMTNELRFSHAGEDRVDGNLAVMGIDPANWRTTGWINDLEYVGYGGRDQFDVGSLNAYEDYATGLAAAHGGAFSRNYTLQNTLTYVVGGGAHTLKGGFTYNKVMVRPQRIGANDNGTFEFLHNTPFNPANPRSFPSRFSIVMGDIEIDAEDTWLNGFVQDQWRLTDRLTLNLGLRYDYQDQTPNTKDALAPRLGFAYDVGGAGRTVIRGGVGRFYEYALIPVGVNLARRGPLGTVFTFDTGEDESPLAGRLPADPCLQPTLNGGLAAISPNCRARLAAIRNSLQPGAGAEFVNTEPWLDGDREMGYLWSYSLGIKRELLPNLGVSIDYVGNRGRNQTAQIDISEGPVGANGRIRRLTPAEFDAAGTLIPAVARNAAFQRVLQYQTLSDFDSKFNSLELSVEKRFSNRWSGRAAYTLAYAKDVVPQNPALNARVSNDLDPLQDYGRSNFDNRHAFVTGFSVNPFGGLTTGAIFRYYSGYPINETIGTDVNGDRDNNDRPVRGVHDLNRPIVSDVDDTGRAVRNGIDGESAKNLDVQVQYIFNLPRSQTFGLFWETYNAVNWINYGNPTANRNSSRFLEPDEAGPMRSMQLGVRYTF
jgi:outer membrane receptor protein involved in Fe transport